MVDKSRHPVDVYVGGRIRQLRWVRGVTQQDLATKVGIKFQQIQKYETGMNRVSASRLWDISIALDVNISYFFDGYGDNQNLADDKFAVNFDKETANLVRYYSQIPSEQRRKIFDLAKMLSDKD